MNKKVFGLFVLGILAASTGVASAQDAAYSPELAEKCKNIMSVPGSVVPEECKVFMQSGMAPQPMPYVMPAGYPTSTFPMPPQGGMYQQPGMPMPSQGYPQDMKGIPQMQPGMPGGFQGRGQMMPQGIGEEQLKQMKRGVKMMERELARIEKRIAALEAKGVKIDASAKDAAVKIRDIIARVNAAQKAEDVESVDMGDFGDLMQTINESMQKAEIGAQFPRILKEADRELTRQQGYLKKADARAALLDVNIGSLLQEWHALVDQMTQIRDKAKADFAAGNTEAAIEAIHEEFFGKMEDLMQKRGAYEMLSNMTRMLRTADREIATSGRTADRLAKKGEDVTKLREYIAEAKQQLADIRAIGKEADVDQEKLIDEIEQFMDIKEAINDEIAALGGQVIQTKLPQIPGLQNFKPFEAPQGFDMFMQGQMPQGIPMQQQQPVQQMMPPQPMMQQQPGGQGTFIQNQQGNTLATMESAISVIKVKIEQLMKDIASTR